MKFILKIQFLIFNLTSQNFAPYLGGGESQNRYRFLVPPAHVVEQGVQSLHGPHPPVSESANKITKEKIIIIFTLITYT